MRQIFLIMIGLSIAVNANFTKNGNIVIDNTTGLQWQDDEVGNSMEWEEAIRHCEELELDEYSDWRVPNINEFKTIVDRSKYNLAIVEELEHTSSYYYWSSTTYESSKNYAWYVYFRSGFTDNDSKSNSYYVRCVRAGQ